MEEKWELYHDTVISFGDGGIDLRGAPKAKKRAKLIAAAPALLEALELALLDIERLCERVDSEVGSLRDFDQIVKDGDAPDSYRKIIAAIAAAKGERDA